MNAPKQIVTKQAVRGASFILLCFAFIQTASAQIAPLTDASSQGVYVRDSAVAVEKLALADRLEHLQEWSKSADVYQELLQQFVDRVAPVGHDKDDHIDRYTSVANIVQDKLAHWPADGLVIYRGRYESEAEALLQQAGDDPAELHKVVSQYFVTDSAKTAAFHLIDTDMENGDFSAAAWLGDRLLTVYPGIDTDRPMLLYRTAIAYRLAGDAADAQSRADDLTKNFAAAQGVVQGKQIALADSLQALLKCPRQSGENIALDSWPMAFGSVDRARVPGVSGFGGAKLFNVPLTKPNLRNVGNTTPPQQQLAHDIAAARDMGILTGVMPVVDRGELFFQDNARIYALNLDSGLPLAGWASTWDGDRNGRYTITAWPTPQNTLQTVALTDDSVLAILDQPDQMPLRAGITFQYDTRLVCLDRRTGKEKWVLRPPQLPGEALQQLALTGAPLVVGDNVYVTAHGTGGIQFQDCYLLCLDLAGHFKWSSYVVSANAGAAIFDGDPNDLSTATPQLAYSGGRVYVLSNLGALAAVDAYDGTIAWLDLYPRDGSNDPIRQLGFGGWKHPPNQIGSERPWTTSPAIVSDGHIFVLPTDGRFLMIYDAGSGAEIQRIKLSDIQIATTLLAVINDRLILSGPGIDGQGEETHVLCINWKTYKPDDPTGANVVWRQTFPVGLRGRGFVTADAVYIPTQKKLFRINIKNGKAEAQYPDGDRVWDSSESSGNILVTQDHLIVAGAQWVNVYTDLNLARAKLDKEVAAAPDDPNVRLRYAEIMFVAGKTDVAVAKLDEAIQVIGGLQNSNANPARDRIFTNAMTFAETLRHRAEDNPAADNSSTGDPAGSEDITTINGLYDHAASAANDSQQQVNYRISRSDFALHVHDATTELKLLQEILTEPTWRAAAVARKDAAGPTQVGNVAEEMIDDLKKNAPDVYGPVQAEAQTAFTAAETTADPAKLLAVAQTYPNSDVAPQAMLKAADAYEAVGNPRQAVQILRQHYLKYPTASDAAEVLESLARNYLATPNHVDVALARLMQGAKRSTGAKLSRPLVLPDGTVIKDVSFEQAADALRRYIEQGTARALPDLAIPAPRTQGDNGPSNAFIRQPDPVALHINAIVLPIKDFGRTDRIVAWSAGAILVFAPGKNDALFTSHLFKDTPINCAWIGDNLLIVSPSKIALIKGDGSSALWETELKSIPVVEVATHDQVADADNAAADQLNVANVAVGGGGGRVVINGRVVFLQGGQRMFLRGPGRVRFGLAGNPAAANPAAIVANAGAEQIMKIALLADRAILATAGGRLISIDLADGKTLWQVRPSDRQVDRLLATDDFVVAQTTNGANFRVISFDTFSGQTVGHREFSNDNGGLVNLALASDGKLVYLLPDHLECFDLFEPADHPAYQVQVKGSDANGAFNGASAPDQLLLTQGRIVALSDEGRFMRIYSLETGKPLHGNDADGADATRGLQTRANDWQVNLATVGSRLYAIGEKSLMAYNLDQFADNWSDNDPGDFVRSQYVVSKDYLLLIGQKVSNNNRRPVARPGSTSVVMRAYSRAALETGPDKGHESGVFAYEYMLNNPAGVTDFQGVDGGIYYLSGDHKLYFLKGARQ